MLGFTRNRSNAWADRQVVIAGASSGLGLHLTLALAKQRARLILVARDAARLAVAQQKALELGAQSVSIVACDVTATMDQNPVAEALGDQGGIDLLINAVGKSDRGALLQLSEPELIELFRINVLSGFSTIKLCLEGLTRNRGCIVQIGSLSSKVAPPLLGGYSVVKFGLAAMCQQLRNELKPVGVHTMLVCPGPIARDDAGKRYEEILRARGLSEAVGQPGGAANLKLLDPEWLADRILQGAAGRECELILPAKVRLLIAIGAFWPALADRWLIPKANRGAQSTGQGAAESS